MKLYRMFLFVVAIFLSHTSTAANLPQGQEWVSVSAINKVVWAGSIDGHVAISSDAGESFELSKLPTEAKVRQLIVLDDHHGYALTSGVGELSNLYVTRNGGFSWRPLYRGAHQEHLRCMAMNPDGEAWVLGDSLDEHWHVVRSNNGKHWNSTRSGFTKRPLPNEHSSNSSDSCVRFENNTWLMGTQNAEVARVMVKEGLSLRFQVLDTPLTAGPAAGVSAVWPLSPTEFFVAGGSEEHAELYVYKGSEFSQIATPALSSAIQVLFQHGEKLYVGNEQAALVGKLSDARNGQVEWATAIEEIGVRGFSCGTEQCWLLGTDNQLHSINP